MKERLLQIITEHPGLRKREIASYANVWFLNSEFMNAMYDLQDEGLIRRQTYNDPANMEFYDMWYAA